MTSYGVTGLHADGRVAFRSANLRGILDYARKHGVTLVSMGDVPSGDGAYTVTFDNGVRCRGVFADPRVMLGWFLARGFVPVIECDRTTFNMGSAMGRVHVSRLCPISQGETLRFGGWSAVAYKEETTHVPMVRFTRGRI